MTKKINKILTKTELSQLDVNEETLSQIEERLSSEVFDDEHDECWAELAKHLIEQRRINDAELVVARISQDWASIAVELQADCTLGYWKQDQSAKAYSSLVKALRLSKGCNDWHWVEAESMSAVAQATHQIGQDSLALAIWSEAIEVAQKGFALEDAQLTLDTYGVLRDIARQLAKAGHLQHAKDTAGIISMAKMRTNLLKELEGSKL